MEDNTSIPNDNPIEPVVPPVVAPPLTFKGYTESLTPEERQYYAENPEYLKSSFVTLKSQELLSQDPNMTDDEAFGIADEALLGDAPVSPPVPQVPLMATPEPPNTSVVKSILSSAHGAITMQSAARPALGVISGLADFGLEAASGALRAADYMAEAIGKDLFDDADSLVYKYKEGLSETTKESIKSLGGLLPKPEGALAEAGENIGTIVLGSLLLSHVAAAGAAVKYGGVAIGEILSGSRVASFLKNHQSMAEVLRLSASGASLDLSATMFSDPMTLAALAPETLKGFNDWYKGADPMTRRGMNLAEGLFLNLAIGALGRFASPGTPPEVLEQALKESELFTKLTDDLVEQATKSTPTVDEALEEILKKTEAVDFVDDVAVWTPKTSTEETLVFYKGDFVEESVEQVLKLTDDVPTIRVTEDLDTGSIFKSIETVEPLATPGTRTIMDMSTAPETKMLRVKPNVAKQVQALADSVGETVESVVKTIDDAVKTSPELAEVPAKDILKAKKQGKPKVAPPATARLQEELDVRFGASKDFRTIRAADAEQKKILEVFKSELTGGKAVSKASIESLASDLGVTVEELRRKATDIIGVAKTKLPKEGQVLSMVDGSLENTKVYNPVAAENAAKKQGISVAKLLKKKGFFNPADFMLELTKVAARGSVSLLKGSVKFAAKSGFYGGAVASYFSGIDVTMDGKHDLRDMATTGLLFALGGHVSARMAMTKEALATMGRDALVSNLKKANQQITTTYYAALQALKQNASSLSPDQVKMYESVVKKLESYLFDSKAGLNDLLSDPNIISKAGATPMEFTQKGMNDLKLSLQSPLLPRAGVDKGFTVERYHLINPQTYATEFGRLVDQVSDVFRSVPGRTLPDEAHDGMLRELGISREVFGVTEDAIRRSARVHTVRGILGSLDGTMKGLLTKETPMTTKEYFEFINVLNQRRALTEYLRAGGNVASDRFIRATAIANKGFVMSMMDDTMLAKITSADDTLNASRLVYNKLAVGQELKGPQITAFLDGVGGNLKLTEAIVQAQYTAMFSNPRTWFMPWVENTVSATSAAISEVVSNKLTSSVGDSIPEAVYGRQGFFQGIRDNFTSAWEEAKKVARGESLGIDPTATKEYFDYKSSTVMQRELSLENPNIITRGFNNLMKMVGVDPVNLTVAPDTFFKQLLFGGYENKLVVEKALDLARAAKRPQDLQDFILHVRKDSGIMSEIREGAMMRARDYTMTSRLPKDSWTQKLMDLHSDSAFGKLIFPIFRTPMVAARHIVRHSPLALLTVKADREVFFRWIDMAKRGVPMDTQTVRQMSDISGRITAGLMMTTAALGALDAYGWSITGSGKFDPSMASKSAQGIRPNGIYHRESGQFVDMERFGLFKLTLGLYQDIVDISSKRGSPTEDELGVIEGVGYMMYSAFLNATPSQIDDFMSICGSYRSPETLGTKFSKYGEEIVTRSYPALFRSVGKASDDYQRAYNGPIDSTLATIYSGLGDADRTRPVLDLYGDPKQYKPGEISKDPLMQEAEVAGFNMAGYMSRRSSVGGVKLGNTPDEQNLAFKAEKLHGERLKRMAPALLKELKGTPDPVKKRETLERILGGITNDVSRLIRKDPTAKRLLDKGGLQ